MAGIPYDIRHVFPVGSEAPAGRQKIAEIVKAVLECMPCGDRPHGKTAESTVIPGCALLGLDSDTFYIYHVAAVMVDNLRRLLLGINLSDKAIMDFDFPGVGFPV